MIEKLQKLNPELKIYSIHSKEFKEYGNVINGFDTSEIVSVGKKAVFPKDGAKYEASYKNFEVLPIANEIKQKLFGQLPAQIGYCYGHSNKLNALEWHTSSEINIAVTPLILILGRRQDIDNGIIDSSKTKAFFLESGDMAEVYATSLHFCPCQVSNDGFGCVVGLPEGTNTPLETEHEPLLRAKNKWLIAHVDNKKLTDAGAVPGITGVNYEIKGE